jgi:hypothetical protein
MFATALANPTYAVLFDRFKLFKKLSTIYPL